MKGRFVDGNLPKVEDPTDGPFTVLKVVGPNLMLGDLRSRRMHETVNEDRVFPYPTRRLNSSEEASELLDTISSSHHYGDYLQSTLLLCTPDSTLYALSIDRYM